MEKIMAVLEKNQERYISELTDFLAFKSVSADPVFKRDMLDCANWLQKHLNDIGLENVQLLQTPSYPVVYADWLHAEGKPTIMIYGHYDVQPADPIELWDSDPFQAVIKEGKIYGRGTADDKGQVWVHIKVIEAYLKVHKLLPVNIRLFIEGDEESGGGKVDPFIFENAAKLASDAVLISDSSWFSEEYPSIIYSLRGMCYMEFTVRGPGLDLHSGQYGGIAPNPLNVCGQIIAKLKDENGTILIPGFYDNITPVTDFERKQFQQIPFDDKAKAREMKVDRLFGEKEYSPIERLWTRPTLDVHGFFGGYTAPGAKTVIASHGTVKVSMRLVAGQSPQRVRKLFEEYVTSWVPEGMSVEMSCLNDANPVHFPIDNQFVKLAGEAIERATGKKTLFVREGASIPITDTFQRALNAPCVLAGFGLATDQIHSPNEHFGLKNFSDGLKMSAAMLDAFGKLSK